MNSSEDRIREMYFDLLQFSYNLAHDLQTPIGVINGFCAMSEDILTTYGLDLSDDALGRLHEYLNIINVEAAGINRKIEGLLEFSRVESQAAEYSRFCLNSVLERVSHTHQIQLNELNGIINFPPDIELHGDEVQLDRVFCCLIGNALKYSKTGVPPVIDISIQDTAEKTIICITDNGIGIDLSGNNEEKIFQVFGRLGPDTIPGDGIGLSVAKRIMNRHDGDITVKSEIGKGSTFCVILPK